MKKIVLVAGLVSALALAACDGRDDAVTNNSTSTTQVLDNGTVATTNTTTTAKH